MMKVELLLVICLFMSFFSHETNECKNVRSNYEDELDLSISFTIIFNSVLLCFLLVNIQNYIFSIFDII